MSTTHDERLRVFRHVKQTLYEYMLEDVNVDEPELEDAAGIVAEQLLESIHFTVTGPGLATYDIAEL